MINLILAMQAIRLPEFQEFMISEMKISEDELTKLKSCGACWKNFSFQLRSIEKINSKLKALVAEGKIRKIQKIKTLRFKDKNEAIKHIKELKNFEIVFISYK